MIRPFSDDWSSRPDSPLPSAIAGMLEALCADRLADTGAYFVVLGQVVRAGDPVWRSQALRVAVLRLLDSRDRGAFLAALDERAEWFSEAVFSLRLNRASAEPACNLLEARDDLESLRSLVTMAVMMPTDPDEVAVLDPLIDSTNRMVFEVDGVGESEEVLEGVLAALANTLPRPLRKRLDALCERDPDNGGWWLAAIMRAKHRIELRQAANALPDASTKLVTWIEDHVAGRFDDRSVESALDHWKSTVAVDWNDPSAVNSFEKDLARFLGEDFRQTKDKALFDRVSKAMFAISRIARMLLKDGVDRNRRRQLATIVTLCMAIDDRVRGNVPEGASVPLSFGNVCHALDAWRTAHQLDAPVAIELGQIVRRELRSNRRVRTDGAVRGMVAVALQLAKQQDTTEALIWLRKADSLASADKTTFLPLAVAAGGFIEFARLLPPREGLALLRRVEELSVECRERARRLNTRYKPFFELRSAVVRATLLASLGDFLGAEAARRQGLNVIRELATTDRSHGLFLQELQLLIDLGDVLGASQAMESYEEQRSSENNRRSRAAATAIKYRRAMFLVANGYPREGLRLLSELASGDPPWRWYAAAALAEPQTIGIANAEVVLALGGPRRWNDIEQVAQRAFREARRGLLSVDDALAANEELLAHNRTDLIAITRKVQLLILRGDADDLSTAAILLNGLSQDERTRDEYILFCQGKLAFKQRRFEAAADFLRAAYEAAPRLETATLLATALTRSGRATEALTTLAAHTIDDAPALDVQGMALIEQGDYVGAWKSLERACTVLADNPEAAPTRFDTIARRLAIAAEPVAKSDKRLVLGFFRRDLRYVAAFANSCMSRFAFSPTLRDTMLEAGDATPSLRFVIAKYGMGGAIYHDTCGSTGDAREWLSVMWKRLELRDNSLVIAEFLAGAKSVYARAVRSAFDGEPNDERCRRYRRWLAEVDTPSEALLEHVISTKQNSNYYRGAADLVAADEHLSTDKNAFIDQALSIISHVRQTSVHGLGLDRHLKILTAPNSKDEHVAAMWGASECAGPLTEVFSATDFGLPFGQPVLLRATRATVRLLLDLHPAPTTEHLASGVKVRWHASHWTEECVRVLQLDELSPSVVESHVIVPYATDRDVSLTN